MERPRHTRDTGSAWYCLVHFYYAAVLARFCCLIRYNVGRLEFDTDRRAPTPPDAALRVARLWSEYHGFADGQGRPKALPIKATGSHDLQEIIFQAVPGANASLVIKQLLAHGFVSALGRGRFALVPDISARLRQHMKKPVNPRPFRADYARHIESGVKSTDLPPLERRRCTVIPR